MRRFGPAAAVFAAIWLLGSGPAGARSPLIPQTEAARHGLTRAWYAQVQLDAGRARVRHLVLHDGTLFVQTDRAMVQAIDAETGETLWARIVGRPDHPSVAPGPGPDLLAVVNGSRLYVLNRYSGDLLFETRLDGAPSAGAGVSQKRTYVPMLSGMVVAHRLEPVADPLEELGRRVQPGTEQERAVAEEARRERIRLRPDYIPTLAARAQGRPLVPPMIFWESDEEEFAAWSTDASVFYIARVDRRAEKAIEVRYRIPTVGAVSTPAAHRPADPSRVGALGTLYFVSELGDVHAVEDRSGELIWRVTTGEPTFQPATLIGGRLFVTSHIGGLYCLDAEDGRELWFAPGIAQFVAAGQQRIYAVDLLGNLQILYAETGARLGSLSVVDLPLRWTNSTTDRIYLATETGLVQCLHEVELSEPLIHKPVAGAPAALPALPDDVAAPPAEPRRPPADIDDPFRAREDDPFAVPEPEDDPFGDADPFR